MSDAGLTRCIKQNLKNDVNENIKQKKIQKQVKWIDFVK